MQHAAPERRMQPPHRSGERFVDLTRRRALRKVVGMQAPFPRGPLGTLVHGWLTRDAAVDLASARALVASHDPLTDPDFQLTLWTLYELHYAGFDDVDDRWEWDPSLLELRASLEDVCERALRELTADTVRTTVGADGALADRLFELTTTFEAPPLSRYVQRRATREQMLELLRHRSVYTLKEADPHTFAIPRLTGGPKVALVEVQYDEYGAGRAERHHARMFADTLSACGLSAQYGAYVDELPASSLAVNNAMSLFGLHRRLRGAAVGHFAAVESTSAMPSRRYVDGLTRLGFPPVAAAYYDEHVVADSAHEQLAVRDVCAALADAEPALETDIVFGAAVCLHLDALAAGELLDSWTETDKALTA